MSKKKKQSTELSLVDESKKIARDIELENDPEKIKELIDLFNLNSKKKSVSRAVKVNGMLDDLADVMERRIKESPGAFRNDELIAYWKALEESSKRLETSSTELTPSPISLTQNNQINIIDSGLNTQSRKNVTETVRKILQAISSGEKSEVE